MPRDVLPCIFRTAQIFNLHFQQKKCKIPLYTACSDALKTRILMGEDERMYQVGELILYGKTGVCRVVQITPETATGPACYVLKPLYQTCSITIPVESPKLFTRPIMTRAEVLQLIQKLPGLEAEPYNCRNLNQLRAYYSERLNCRSCEELAKLAKSLYLKRSQAEAQKKKLGVVDERYLREAENLLFGEIAAALEIRRDEVPAYIESCLNAAES